MKRAAVSRIKTAEGLPKAPTGIPGLNDITGGGLPRGRPTLVCGAAGCGKTLLAMEFLVRGAAELGEPLGSRAGSRSPRTPSRRFAPEKWTLSS